MAKVLETIVKEEAQEFLELRKILPEDQFEFRAMHFAEAIDLFDLEKAYERVWRAGLLLKPVELRVPLWLADRLSDTNLWVRMMTSGFNVFVADLLKAVRVPETLVFQYTDDTAILATGNTGDRTIARLELAISKVSREVENYDQQGEEDRGHVTG